MRRRHGLGPSADQRRPLSEGPILSVEGRKGTSPRFLREVPTQSGAGDYKPLRREASEALPGRDIRGGCPDPLARRSDRMKLILAIIQPSKLEAVKEALNKVEVFRLTIVDVQGFGRQKGHTEVYRGHELTVNMLRKVQLQIAVNEDFVEPTVNAIMDAARTGPEGRIGDGKIFILPLEDCIRIRTGERGPEAI